MSKYNVYLKKVEVLHSLGKTNSEISKILELDSRRISDLLKKLGLNKNEKKLDRDKPNEIELDYIIANAIGDGCFFKCKASKNYRMTLKHSLKQKDYLIHKHEMINSFSPCKIFEIERFHKYRNKNYKSIGYQTRVHPFFTEIYENWYENGKKIIKKENVHLINERVLALKYFDDGYKGTKGGYYIAMDDYDESSLEVFKEHLKKEFKINGKYHVKNRFYITKEESIKLKNILNKYATKDLFYKI